MGAGRRTGFVRSSDEEDEGSGGLTGVDGAGPSSSRVPRKRSKRPISHAGVGPQNTAGKTKEYKRLKHTVKSKITDLDSDSDEEDYELEDITASASRHTKSRRKEDRGFTKKQGKTISLCKKRKQSFFSAQKPYSSKAGGIYFEETEEESSQKQTADAVEPPIGKEFEQYLLEEVFTISKDTYTKEADLPERFQIHEQFVSAYISKGDWSKEACWIYDRAFGNPTMILDEEELKVIADIDKEVIVPEIIFVLVQLHVQKCEIPFIGMYNFHGCMHLAGRSGSSNKSFNFEENNLQLRSFKALWSIFHLDKKWLLLQHHIDKQQESWKKRAVIKESECVTKDGMLDKLVQALQDAESEPMVDDLVAKFDLLFPTDEETQPKGQYKRPRRQSYYDICCKSGLRQLVKELGLTPEQLGENLQAKEKIHEALDCDAPPEGVDLSCTSGQFSEVHRALAGARHMAAYEISCEPRVRNYVRGLFTEHAVLSTRSTAKGNSLIDAFHEFSCVKYVQGKPVKELDDGEWLLMQRAEEEQLVEVTIELTGEVLDREVMQGLKDLYLSNASNEVAVLWNEQRNLTLLEAVSKIMIPIFIKEMRMSLTAKAKAWVQDKCGKVLWKRVSVAPYIAADCSPDAYQSSKATSDYTNARVLACCWGSRNPPTTFVMLDAFGELVDTLQTGYLNVHSGSLDQQFQRKIDDQERLQKFMVKHQPHVVVVGATVHHACRQLKDTIIETVTKAAELNTGLSSVPVIFGDESLPLLCEKAQLSSTQLPKHPSIIKRAIALGRSLQNPLALISSLCNPSKDIVALNLHPMQQFLCTEELYSAIEQVMITVTNQVGVDVNLAVAHEWLFSPLQFICGLGWKKASILQQLIQELRWLPSRGHLLRHPFLLKDVVFRNCSGFLRIRRVAHAVSGLRKLDPLDDTRIHPDSYELAQSLANHALSKGEDLLGSEADLEMAETAIAYIQQNPDILSEATVMDFFSSLADVERLNLETLKDIRSELLCGFRDYRAPYTQPTQDEEFSWLTGEDDYSLATGKPVNVTVHKVFRHRVICTLESGIRGVLEKENFTSDSSVDLATIFSEGSTLTCCIANVMKDQFLVNLTCKEAEDHNTDASSAQERLFSDKASEKLSPKEYLFKPRDVCHSHFDNVSVSDAIKALSDKNPGEVIFHPSSRGPACLSMTLKCHNDVYLRKEIEELNKDSTNLATFSKLGRILKIGGRSFQNLDEVVTSYASPLLGKTNEVLQSKEFQFGSDSEIKSFLHREKGVSSESLVYCFSMCPDDPGAIAVSYIVDGNFKRETVDLYPEGYRFQGKMFRKVDTLINYLKKAVLAASYGPQMWGRRGETCDGTGHGGGRGGRFGSGRRGRGRDGRGGRGNGSRDKWGDQNKDGIDGFGDARENAQEGGTFSGGWGDKDDWSQSQNNNRGNDWGHGERGSFRGRRGRGRGYGRGGEGGQWGQAHSKGEENFWSGVTKGDVNTDPQKVPEIGAGNNSWDAGNAGNDGWGIENDGWASTDGHVKEHNKTAEKDLSSWGAESNTRDFSEEKGNERVQNSNAGKRPQDNKSNGLEGWGMASEPLVTGFKDTEDAKQIHDGWDAVDIQASKCAGNAGNDGWGTGNDGWESTGCQTNEHRKKNEKVLSSWSPEHNGKNASEEKGNCWVQDGNAEKDFQDNKSNGSEGRGKTSKPLDTVAKDVEIAKDSFDGWDTVEKAALQSTRSADKAGDAGWGTGNDGWGSMDCHEDELKKTEKDLSNWGAEHKSLEERGNGWAQDGDKNCGGVLGKGPNVGGWGDEDSRQKHRDSDMGWGAQKGQSDSGGLLGKTPTDDGWGKSSIGGWDGNDSHEKHAKDDMGWGAQKGQNNDGGLLGKAPTVGGWGESAADGWGDGGSKEKDRSSDLGWGVQKEQHKGGWGGSDGLEEKWSKDGDQRQTQISAEGFNGRGFFRGGRGWSRGMGSGGRGRESQGEGGMGRGGRGRWSQGEDGIGGGNRGRWSQGEGGMGRGNRGRWPQGEGGMGRGNRGRWSQNEGGARGGRGGWQQSRGDGAGRRGRGGRGRWNDADSMGRSGRGSWAHKHGEGASENNWSSDGWNRESNAGKATATDANDWWASGGHQDTAQKERGRGNCWSSKDSDNKEEAGTQWDGWATSSREVETGGWGSTLNNIEKTTKETPAQNFKDGANVGWGNTLVTSGKTTKKTPAGTGWEEWAASSSSDIETVGWGDALNNNGKTIKETVGWGDALNNNGKTTKETPAQNCKEGATIGSGDTLNNSGRTTKEIPAGTGWDGWPASSGDVEPVGSGDTLNNSGESTKETPAQNLKDGATVGWGGTLDNIGKATKNTPAQNQEDGGKIGWGTWTESGECANNGSSNVGVTPEKSSDLGANDGGWKSSSDTGHVNDCVDVERRWDAHVERHVSHSCGSGAQKEWSDSVHMHTERTWAEPPTQGTAPMESESGFKEFNSKEGTEERGDGIWGACEDLIDSKEMEGLISRKGPFDNVLEPQNMNDALQVQEAISEGLGDADHDRLDNLAVSILEDQSSDKNNRPIGAAIGQ